MAQRGRKPKPTALKELEGNPGKRELNTKEPKPKQLKVVFITNDRAGVYGEP